MSFRHISWKPLVYALLLFGLFSLAMAGGGIRGGVVHGASDNQGAYPLEGIVTPADFTATLYHCLGYSADTRITDPLGREFPISRGQVVREVLG